jgi:CcmD family protein
MLPATNNWSFITAAYAVAWIGLAGYWVFLHRTVRRARVRYEQAVAAAPRARGKGT